VVVMVLEHEREYSSQWSVIVSIASKIGYTAKALRKWERRTESDAGCFHHRLIVAYDRWRVSRSLGSNLALDTLDWSRLSTLIPAASISCTTVAGVYSACIHCTERLA